MYNINFFRSQLGQAAIASMLEEYTHRLAQPVHENDALRKENEQLRSLY